MYTYFTAPNKFDTSYRSRSTSGTTVVDLLQNAYKTSAVDLENIGNALASLDTGREEHRRFRMPGGECH